MYPALRSVPHFALPHCSQGGTHDDARDRTHGISGRVITGSLGRTLRPHTPEVSQPVLFLLEGTRISMLFSLI